METQETTLDETKNLFESQKILIQIKRQSIKNALLGYERQKKELQDLRDMIAKELGIKENELVNWRFDENEGRFIKIGKK